MFDAFTSLQSNIQNYQYDYDFILNKVIKKISNPEINGTHAKVMGVDILCEDFLCGDIICYEVYSV